jgi:hypothetical protein
MSQARPDPRDRKLAQLQARVLELETKLAEAERLRSQRELSLLEDGLRLSQENEALRKELAELKRLRKTTGPG